MPVTVRFITGEDAEAFLQLCLQLDSESDFMLLEPGERRTTVEEQRLHIHDILSTENQAIFVAEHQGKLVGYLAALGGRYRRNRHVAQVIVAVLQPFWRQGIGTGLFTEMERWAWQHGLHRLELTVITHNEAALALYRKMGFQIEGTRRHALLIDGVYVDEYYMAKLLS